VEIQVTSLLYYNFCLYDLAYIFGMLT